MQEAEEQDTCRICSAPAEPEQPLFYPCKCSGTIRYIHQDCLTTWLAHSKKKTCDVCKHPYSFTKVYATDMPTRLPPVLVLRRVAQQAFFALLFALRGVVVAGIWLAVLPWATVMTWRMYFAMGDSTAWWISDRPRPADAPEYRSPIYMLFYAESPTAPPPDSFFGRVAAHPLWQTLSADIFTGQIIASLVVLTFVAVFLLREWISQNARPGVFEDEEQPAQAPPVLEEAPPPAQERLPLPRQNAMVMDRLELAERRRHVLRNLERARQRPVRNRRIDDDELPIRPLPARRLRKPMPPLHDETAPADLTNSDKFEFTFRSPRELPRDRARRSFSAPPRSRLEPDSPSDGLRRRRLARNILLTEEEEQPRHLSKKRQIDMVEQSNHRSHVVREQGPFDDESPRRPELPSIDPVAISLPSSPRGSPTLATYRAPEELELDDSEPGPATQRWVEKGKGKAKAVDQEPDAEFEHLRYLSSESEAEDDDVAKEGDSTMPRLQSVSDSDSGELIDRSTPSPGRNTPELRSTSSPDSPFQDIPSPRDEFNEDDDEMDEDDEGEDEDDDLEGPPRVAFNPNAPVWQAIQIEDDEVAEVGDGEMDGPAQDQDQGPAPPIADGGIVDAAGDDFDGNVEDDMDGAMEAIGMRGPVFGVIQNAALMIFVLDTAIGLLVWIPFTLGKSTALLVLNPHRLLKILHLPIRAIRLLTDPIVDSVMYIIASLLIPFITRTLFRLVNVVFVVALFITSMVLGQPTVDRALETSKSMLEPLLQFLDQPFEHIMAWNAQAPAPSPAPSPPSVLSKYQSDVIDAVEPYFAVLGKEVRVNALHLGEGWTQLALGYGAKDRIFAIFLGYLVLIFLVALYLNLLTVGNMKSAGRAVRTAVREQLLVVKVAAFIFIELVTFPLGCGIVLDLCTVFLFPEANMASRIEYFKFAPLTAMFYHWVAGTMFMYSFAVLLAGCRSLLRKGAMWFIKDPQDQNSHPIRDILDRPTLTQLRKIFISGIMYSVVVACVVGSVASLLYVGQKSILPFRWKNREPLSDVPLDLIFLHLSLPYTMHYLRPRTGIKRVSKALWKLLARRLRLSSYFFGGRYLEEEFTVATWSDAILGAEIDMEDPKNIRDGSFRRVPASDNIALPREMRATAAVSESGHPIDEEAAQLMIMQDQEAVKAKRHPHEDYMVVYLPPKFRYRVFFFVAILWVIGAIFLGLVFALPIQLGRGFFALFVKQEVHDGYSFIIGAYLLWGCYLIGRAVDRLDKRRQRRGGDDPRADLWLLVIKRGLLWLAKITYMALFLGIVVPTLVSLVVDLYIVLPIRLSLDPTLVPRVRIVDSWAMGLLYSKIMLHVILAQPHNNITRGLQHIMNNGWTHPEPVAATKQVIGPLTFGLMGMIFLPGGVFVLVRRYLPLVSSNSKLLFMEVYPAIFVAAACIRFGSVIVDMLGTWSQAIRDKEFLVELRLRNLEMEVSMPIQPGDGDPGENDAPI
ncbi:RING-CH-type domain-containing protein [Mycena indigotica]|uniref:RING-type E3 ubiquitin transferase n=1 Tax=Mycena indigotica TaxID=2126181 RepID=A0A8H6T326_9AGAR|nr:RING-CH-type domain-containing protein [Mycena indigotica]KAF7309457.1 RING-CH-type domain-containing protein [Mycena indigotica]